MESLIESETFSPDWPDLGLIRGKLSPSREKTWFQEPRVVSYSFNVQLLLIILVFSHNGEV